jgi:hypothetical protein
MTTYQNYNSTIPNDQDHNEVGVYGEVTYPEVGAIIRVRGNDTEDQEVEVAYYGGVSFKLPKDFDAEVTMISTGNDTTLKVALLSPPKDKYRRWKENTGGLQHPTDPEHALEFNKTRAHVTKDAFAVGPKGTFEVKDGKVFVRGDLTVEGVVIANKEVKSPVYNNGSQQIAALENPAEQDKVTKDSGTGNA